MKRRKVISRSFLPTRGVPTIPTIVYWLLLERLGAPGWVWGVVGTLVVVLWAGCLWDIFSSEAVEPVLKDKP